jgi:hypothetical protein
LKRIFLGFLIMVLVVLLVPPVRERAQPGIDRFRGWAGHHLEGPMTPVLTPIRRVKAQSEMSRAVSKLVSYRNRGYPPPKASEFQDFLRQNELSETGEDPWGSPYVLTQTPDSVGIVSAGADMQYRTDDDIVSTIRFPHQTGRSTRRGRR